MKDEEIESFFEIFKERMKEKYLKVREEKGDNWLNPNDRDLITYLIDRLIYHSKTGNYVNAANYAMLLYFNENGEERNKALRNAESEEICIDDAHLQYESDELE